MRIKVCGLKTREAVEQAAALPIDYVGFVFAKSKRQVTAEQARDLLADLPRSFQAVGVFVDAAMDDLLFTAETAGLDVLQLHGEESPAFCRELRERSGRAVWKAWGVRGDHGDQQVAEYADAVDAVLLDNARGGTGQTFSWTSIPALAASLPGVPLFVAGGLHPGNVEELISRYRPDGIDVSSGVESDGVKDPEKITDFVMRARKAQ
ncbi:phosphoribosylanthranilate isomerase [Tumebacillus sp. DT12]|uniref:N-(5'-phosphoribosyl)anthranilate isomerase n=1 Tax=Tumebacillus lacus TaxID=2995335 RepID=A0ABT3WYN4_9BACL|nr:phosphoribosylanthranilate isomerase [Tumebacillus lacus]MCX7568872.1 phosphoribosylanthranilate isomerase [Tumebacillus lacus]